MSDSEVEIVEVENGEIIDIFTEFTKEIKGGIKKPRQTRPRAKKIKVEKKEMDIECPICIEMVKEGEDFRCMNCKNTYCTVCMKTYLLQSNNEPHCMNCKHVIPYSQFVDKFDIKWRLGLYKKHKEQLLWNKELSLMPNTVGYLELLNRKRQTRELMDSKYEHLLNIQSILKTNSIFRDERPFYTNLYNQLLKDHASLRDEYYDICNKLNEDKTKTTKYKWVQSCLTEGCKGFLNAKYKCILCKKAYCKDCLVNIDFDHDDEENIFKTQHVCDEGLKETVKMIRKDSKPCPKCSEFISKITGCDQMFCTSCGTAFSWTTGEIERGVIHNPHAHDYFQNNREAYENYMNNRNGLNNACRDVVPTIFIFNNLSIRDRLRVNQNEVQLMDSIKNGIAEFFQYENPTIELNLNREEDNQQMRIDYLRSQITEKRFKTLLHMKYKKISFLKLTHDQVKSTMIVIGNLLWSLLDIKSLEEFDKIKNMIHDILNCTNNNLRELCEKHNYKNKVQLDNHLRLTYRYGY